MQKQLTPEIQFAVFEVGTGKIFKIFGDLILAIKCLADTSKAGFDLPGFKPPYDFDIAPVRISREPGQTCFIESFKPKEITNTAPDAPGCVL